MAPAGVVQDELTVARELIRHTMKHPTLASAGDRERGAQAAKRPETCFGAQFPMRCVVKTWAWQQACCFLSPDGSDCSRCGLPRHSDEQLRLVSATASFRVRRTGAAGATERQCIWCRYSVSFMGQGVFAERKDRRGWGCHAVEKGDSGVSRDRSAHPMTTEGRGL